MKITKVNIAQKLDLFTDYWNPRIVGELNQQHVKLAKLKGEFVMHKHDQEDEMFMVIKGCLKIKLENEMLSISEGEFVIIPKGKLHQPIADEEVHIMLFEPATTVNTGDLENDFTKNDLDKI